MLLTEIDDAAVWVIRFAGIAFLLLHLLTLYVASSKGDYTFADRLLGKYWFAYWIPFFTFLLSSQLLWIKRIKSTKWLRLVFSVAILLMLSIEKIIVLITSLQREYVQNFHAAKWASLFFLRWGIQFVEFAVFVGLAYWVKRTLSPVRERDNPQGDSTSI